MSVIDTERLLQELSPDAPSGEDLEYDPVFQEMELASQAKPEQEYGGTVVPAEDPDWRTVKARALDLLGRTKDLRVLMKLSAAVIRTDGIGAFAECVEALRTLVEKFWDSVHPQLDPEDNNDPTMRMNVLVALCDGEGVLRGLRDVPLVSSRGLGQFSLRHILIANGTLQPGGAGVEPPPDLATIEAAFMDADVGDLQATSNAVQRSLEALRGVETALTEAVGAQEVPDLSPLETELKQIQSILGERLEQRGVGTGEIATDQPVGGGEAAPASAGTAQAPARQGLAGEVTSREDVIRALDKVSEYYERNEPSSPVPFLLRRAKRLVKKDFMEIMRDLAPDGVSQAETITGIDSESE